MNLLKIFLINLFIIISVIINAEQVLEIYRSNSNGLSLVKINNSEKGKYKYILEVYLNSDKIQKKILYKDNIENKSWRLYYTSGILSKEQYYKEGVLTEEYYYDPVGHKNKQIDYKDKKPLKVYTYIYNKEGLVETENNLNIINNQTTTTKFKYDKNFRIKQIERDYPDSRLVFWEAFFSLKGIIVEEHYTLKDQKYTFWYNENGQEIKGELKDITDFNNNKIIKEWNTTYTKNGKIDKKDEMNFDTGKRILTWYNQNLKETKIETSLNDKVVSIEKFEYTKNNKVNFYEKIEGLNSTKIYYDYDDKDNIVKEQNFQNDKLKKIISYNADKSRSEIIYSQSSKVILIEYDKDNKIISEKQIK